MSQRTVVVVQRRLTHYRVPLFEKLREELLARNIQLEVLVGSGTADEVAKNDSGEIQWAKRLPTSYLTGIRLCWQPFGPHLAGKDLVIVAQENKLLYNHLLLLRPRRFRLAFWGHGADLQSDNRGSLRARFKRWTTNRVDWWFAYTQMSADIVAADGFPAERITVLNNAVDTEELRRVRQEITADESDALRQSLGMGSGPVGVCLGSLYADKRLDFLFAAAERVKSELPEFRLLVVGDGPERQKVEAWCACHPWASWVGARHGKEKVAYLSIAQIMLNPGIVGLNILDSFALGLPMVTTRVVGHGPEIAYLNSGTNGIMTGHDVTEYASVVTTMLCDRDARERLCTACTLSASEYTLENMINRFADGIERVLEH